ncbi:carboxypeptidase-like regulatory domain-containing protein [Cellulophaga sp. L1A9]|uniref:carboxypeptidase-like regulatory domain-containing protein n=1 Tax=Cellulophaga sp. L1A9 TaxID=2686362 RepID=UPI00131BCAF6|nr:carboxypeptidase-like regulatory domain-containing protein [Cellulophaga sp. L1A9]
MSLKIIYTGLFILCLLSSCGITKHIQRYAIEGYVVDSGSIPINKVLVKFLMDENQKGILLLSEKDSTRTNADGYYRFREISSTEVGFMGGEASKKLPVSYKYIISKKGFINDTVNLRSKKLNRNILKIDTIFLKSK